MTAAHPLRATVLRALQVAPRNSAELSRALSRHAPKTIGMAATAPVAAQRAPTEQCADNAWPFPTSAQ